MNSYSIRMDLYSIIGINNSSIPVKDVTVLRILTTLFLWSSWLILFLMIWAMSFFSRRPQTKAYHCELNKFVEAKGVRIFGLFKIFRLNCCCPRRFRGGMDMYITCKYSNYRIHNWFYAWLYIRVVLCYCF